MKIIIHGNTNPGEKGIIVLRGNPRSTRQAPKGQAGVPQFEPLKEQTETPTTFSRLIGN